MILIGFHLALCALLIIFRRIGIIRTDDSMIPVILLIPVVGPLIYLERVWMEEREKAGKKQIDLEKMEIDDVRYARIDHVQSNNESITVPLEEAMEINESRVRRSLIMDILRRDPDSYLTVLERASLSDDTELSHYATTSMMGIQSRYEKEIGDMEKLREQFPDHVGLEDKYIRTLRKYIDSGMISGQVKKVYQGKLDGALKKMLNLDPGRKAAWYESLMNQIQMGETDGVEKTIVDLIQRWPEEQRGYQVYMALAEKLKDPAMAAKVIEWAKDENVYLTREGKNWLEFWQTEKAENS